jgi:L-2-hydroxyglutarate oxidase
MKNVIIIGGGIVGLATAYKLSILDKDLTITVLEKEADVGQHQSTHNSGVLHCGLYYKPGTLKAKCAVDGIKQMTAFCQRHDIPHEICGKIVVATDAVESARLMHLYKNGKQNQLTGLKLLNREELQTIEPYINKEAIGLQVPQEGIVDYAAVVKKLKELIIDKGHKVLCNENVYSINTKHKYVSTNISTYNYNILINCAGLYSDRVSKLTTDIKSRIIPFRGEYYKLKKESEYLVNNLIYPVPNPKFPFLGVHFTRLINGGIEAGPNAVLAFSREGYNLTKINVNDVWDYISFKGFWKFIYKHKWMCLSEFYQSISKKQFCKSLQKLIPSIKESDLEHGGSGVRAQAMSYNGELITDFELNYANYICNVINAPSPAATASLSIADEIIKQIYDI